jgi:hypothetical protein
LLKGTLKGEDLKCESVKCTPARMVFMLNGLWISGSIQSSGGNDNSIWDILGGNTPWRRRWRRRKRVKIKYA